MHSISVTSETCCSPLLPRVAAQLQDHGTGRDRMHQNVATFEYQKQDPPEIRMGVK